MAHLHEVSTLVGLKEVANILSIHPRTVYRIRCREPEFPNPIIIKPLKWRLSDIRGWLKREERKNASKRS